MRDSFFLFILIAFFACTGNEAANKENYYQVYKSGVIYGEVAELPGRKVLLYELYGDEVNLLDSVMADDNGSFKFHFSEKQHKGLYRLAMGKSILPGHYDQHRQEFDLIWDGSTVVFRTHYAAPVDSMKIIHSEENRLYYQFLRYTNDFDLKISVLNNALINYPRQKSFYRKMERQHNRVQNRRSNYIDNLVKKNSGSIFSTIARFQKLPRVSSPGSDIGLAELKRKFFHEGQFADSILIYTDLIPRKIIRYLTLYADKQHSDDEQQEELIMAVDVIMKHAIANEAVFYFVLEYLINGFESMEMDLVSDHLRGRYLTGEICFEEGRLNGQVVVVREGDFEAGDKVPGFRFTALDGRKIDLAGIQAKYTLVVFWGSWCPHCKDIMDGLYDLYRDYHVKKEGFLEVVAIGIEDDKQMWLDMIAEGGYDWINFSSLKRWDCPIARDYDLFGTPTMILLDADKRVLLEPLRLRALNRYLSRRLNN